MSLDDKKDRQVIDIQKIRARKAVKKHMNGKGPSRTSGGPKNKIFAWIQFFLFLALVSYLMKVCQGGGGGGGGG
jgi:hypothetical protein